MGTRSAKLFEFTPREKVAAALLAKGKSRKEIAEAMTISVRTVEAYVWKIRQKVDAPTMFAAGCILSHYRIR